MEISGLVNEVDAILEEYRALVDPEMARVLDAQGRVGTLYDMMRFHLGWTDERFKAQAKGRGKRFRPAMCLLTCEALGGNREKALPAAAAIELVHNFSLIHDDIEDRDRVRRGRPTVWALWGSAQGINVGDGMHTLANVAALGLRSRGVHDNAVISVLDVLNGAVLELCEGQYLDLMNEPRKDVTVDEYLNVISRKTAALIECATHCGAILATADAETQVKFARFGRMVGLAFQIRDDVLGVISPEKLGKKGASDILRRKRNLPYLMALDHSPKARRLLAIYRQRHLTKSDEKEVLAIFGEAEVYSHCREVAQKYEQEAFKVLEEAPLKNEAAEKLLTLSRFLVDRER